MIRTLGPLLACASLIECAVGVAWPNLPGRWHSKGRSPARDVAQAVATTAETGPQRRPILERRRAQAAKVKEAAKSAVPLPEAFNGLRVALAWHGIYQRHNAQKHAGRMINSCSDFFSIASNVEEFIIGPLTQSGAKVTNYVHTYTRYDCPRKDRKLLEVLKTSKYVFWNVSDHRIVDSYIEVLRMVQNDKDPMDFVVMMRFDVQYTVPITQWNITLDTIGIPFMDQGWKWERCSQVSDLLFTLPTGRIPALIHALDWSGNTSTSTAHTIRAGEREEEATFCDHKIYHGAGHFVWQPLVQHLGRDAVRLIDHRMLSSDQLIESTKTFLGIDRTCSKRYFSHCRHANVEWVSNGLW